MNKRIKINKDDKVLLVALSGMGNAIMLSPTIATLKKNCPENLLYLLTRLKSVERLYNCSDVFEEIFVIETSESKLTIIKKLLELRKINFDVMLVGFPSNRIEYNIVSAFINAKYRLIHSYPKFDWRTLNWVNNIRIPAIERIHDVEQNMRLLSVFEGSEKWNNEKETFICTDEESEKKAEEICLDTNNKKPAICFHFSSASSGTAEKIGKGKRERTEKIVEKLFIVMNRIKQKVGDDVGFFYIIGPGESGIKSIICEKVNRLEKVIAQHIHFIENEDILTVACLLRKMDVLFNFDSGIGHLASAVGTNVITKMGHTDPTRTRPWGDNVKVIEPDLPCFPCKAYPFHSTNPKVKCKKSFICVENFDVVEIERSIIETIRAKRQR